MPYIELQGESRGYSVTSDSVTQTFVYRICHEDTDEDDAEFGDFFTPNDDVGIAKFVYETFPFYRVFPVTPTQNVVLILTSHSGKEDGSGWVITLTYTIPPGNQADPEYVQFGVELGGETIHISKSLQTLNWASAVWNTLLPPDTWGLIGLNGDEITGTDIIGKSFNFYITSYFDPSVWNYSALNFFYQMIGTVNNNFFYGFNPGEVLLTSITAQGNDSYQRVPVTFNFTAKPNAYGIADYGFPPLYAYGHDVIDYRWSTAVNQNSAVKIPNYRFVHRVYNYTNFALLGIGTG